MFVEKNNIKNLKIKLKERFLFNTTYRHQRTPYYWRLHIVWQNTSELFLFLGHRRSIEIVLKIFLKRSPMLNFES